MASIHETGRFVKFIMLGSITSYRSRHRLWLHQGELQRQGENVDGDIAHARKRLVEVDQERAFYQRQAARGKIIEQEFDVRMEETKDVQQEQGHRGHRPQAPGGRVAHLGP
jgi:hypothetical protein